MTSNNIIMTMKPKILGGWKLCKGCLKLTFKLLAFMRLILTCDTGAGLSHWSQSWTMRGFCSSLPLITGMD